MSRFAALVLALTAIGCSGSPRGGSSSARREAAAPAVTALREGRFTDSWRAADKALASDPDNAQAAVVRAIVRYRETMDQLRRDLEAAVEGFNMLASALDDRPYREALARAEERLAEVDRDLARAAGDDGFSLELCPACWREDWNGNGEVDQGDELLLQVELDVSGKEIPDGDPRRKPTFRFDVGDVHWARAMVAFQRAGMNLFVAYRWGEAMKLRALLGGTPDVIRFPLGEPERVKRARELILSGLDDADRSREAYLAETDDEREWVPGPQQGNHPLPLPVDQALYDTWEAVIDDVRALVRGEQGIDLAELARLIRPAWTIRPAYLDIGGIFSRPRDIVIDLAVVDNIDSEDPAQFEAAMRAFLGSLCVDHMKPSPLVGRLSRMRNDIQRGDDTFGRKLRYLIWLN